MENKKINEVEEIEEVQETEETKSEGFGAKVVGGFKKHGKKIAIGVASVVGLGIAYCLGAKSAGKDEDSECEIEEDIFEVEFAEENETE
ncbi:MAG: hypothetical protein IIX75_03930 [Clostridia bacterium]|nr:hypothetical protein [Clostridia bacterium]